MIFLCVVTSYVYTELYVVNDAVILERIYFKNIDFQSNIVSYVNDFFERYQIQFISLFTGPAPLISCRVSLLFFQALLFVKNIPYVVLSGFSLYRYDYCDVVIVQNFSGKYVVLEKNTKMKELTIQELKNTNFCDLLVSVVSRENHILEIDRNNATILFPNQELIVKKTLQKINTEKTSIYYEKIVPFL
jgi:hypothetical protein